MFNVLRDFSPQPVLLDLGLIKIYWYGLVIGLAVLICLRLFKRFADKKGLVQEHVYGLFFYVLIFGLIGGRLWHVLFYNWQYFKENPIEIVAVWNGGLAIWGAITAGLITAAVYCKKSKISFWQIADLLAVVMPLGQAIGRFGNWFNQELFGPPCSYFWCVPIGLPNRPDNFLSARYFHPLFLYEAILNILLFIILYVILGRGRNKTGQLLFAYLAGYSAIRFLTEFLRLDAGNWLLGLTWVQWFCLVVFAVSSVILVRTAKIDYNRPS